jgi:CRISPR-associated protein Cmr3
MTKTTWRFKPLDSLFFKESRPMEAIGGSELASAFPPPIRTLAGAVRTAIGDHHDVDWKRFAGDPDYLPLRDQIGMGDDLGAMRVSGPWMAKKIDDHWQRLFPVPCQLLGVKQTGDLQKIVSLEAGKPRLCDLGCNVRLPVTPLGAKGFVGLQDYWINGEVFGKILATDPIAPEELIPAEALFSHEARFGIAIDNRLRTVEKSRLYQTRHVRLKSDVAIEVDIEGLDASFLPKGGVIRLGGEGRGAIFQVLEQRFPDLQTVQKTDGANGVMIVLLTHTRLDPNAVAYTVLPGFKKEEQAGQTVWKGRIHGHVFTLVCAATGKAVREGGWDLLQRRPRPVSSLIPAGSVFLMKSEELDIPAALETLNFTQLDGSKTDLALGRGLITAGIWCDTDAHSREEI